PTPPYTLSLHDALPIYSAFSKQHFFFVLSRTNQLFVSDSHLAPLVLDVGQEADSVAIIPGGGGHVRQVRPPKRIKSAHHRLAKRSEEHTSELQSRSDLV